jgi:protein SCO1
MSGKGFFYIVIFILLAAGIYFFSPSLISGFKPGKIPPISKVGAFNFTTQDGHPFTNKEVDGKVYVAEYFFTTCKTICPIMNKNMKQVYNQFKGNPGFMIVSHTCDPAKDSASKLKAYADSMKVNTKLWVFVTGRKDSLYNMARSSYTIADPANKLVSIEDDFVHTQFWALVNRKGDVLKIYDGLKQEQIDQLMKDIEKELKNE